MDRTELQRIKQRYNIVGNSDDLNRALDVALQVASTDLSVLIIGESGVGKEIIPKLIHDNSTRKREKYFSINCGAIPEGTINSELFGHEKGSFTGAIGESEGYFGIANKGTIFLDEVGEMPLSTQAMLLRVLETGEYIRVGGTEVRKTNIRIIAATNVNMQKAISQGKFREDLYYRLNTIPIQMPALRNRGEDILLLFRLFAMQMAEKYNLPKITLSEEAKTIMLNYKWPGNVRQLKNVTERLSVLGEQREITAEMLSDIIPNSPDSTELILVNGKNSKGYENEREMLYSILYELRGNITDLRREVNTLRDQLEETKAMKIVRNIDTLQEDATATLPTVASAPIMPTTSDLEHIEYVEAEEISEDEIVNLNDVERKTVQRVLERNHGNRKKAALELGISDRTLYRRIKQYGLENIK